MKRNLFLLVLSAFFLIYAQAQIPPQAFNYSAVARDAQQNPIANQTIGIQFTIRQTTTIGPILYSENHFVNTDQYGLFNLIIGTGAIQSGSMSVIDWSNDNYFLQIGMDANGGTNFLTMGTTQFISVPYALHAATADSLIGGGSMSETDPVYSAAVASGITAGDTTNWNADIDPNNELQTISISNDTLYLSNGGFAVLPASAGGGGKTHLYLVGDITDAQAAVKIQNEAGPNTQFVTIRNTTNLTSVDLSSITECISIQINDNPLLNNVNFSNLQAVHEELIIVNNPLLATGLSFSNVQIWPFETIQINNTSIPSLTFSNLTFTDTLYNSINITNNSLLTTINFPDLTQNSIIGISGNNSLTSISFGALTNCHKWISITSNPLLTSVGLPLLSNIDSTGYLSIAYNNSLSNIDLSGLTNIYSSYGQYYFSYNQLSSTSINLILDKFVNSATPVTNTWIYLQGQNPPAPPTGQGVIDVSTLQGQGNTVNTD